MRGVLSDEEGEHLTGTIGVLLCIYQERQGGSTLWQDVQNIEADKLGDFSLEVIGLSEDVSAAKKPLWLGQLLLIPGQSELPRIRLSGATNGLRVPEVVRLVIPKSAGLQRVIPEDPEAPEESFYSTADSNVGGKPSASSESRPGDESDMPAPRKWAKRRARAR
jgi:hypothetical protein